MADALLTIKLYYDYKSPFAYLAMHPAYALMESHRVRLHYIPHELDVRGAFGGDLEDRPEREWRKVRYLYLDARRYANARGLIIRGPQKIFDSKLALMSGLWADRHGLFRPYSDRVFERFFKRELDIENPQRARRRDERNRTRRRRLPTLRSTRRAARTVRGVRDRRSRRRLRRADFHRRWRAVLG